MAEYVDEWAAKGRKNMFGETVRLVEMQSEAGAAGAVHGSLQAGALTTTYTASQGLLLMIPNMYKIAGELLPCVFHVSARALAAHALNIFGDHADIYSARQTGFAMLASGSVQEVMDLSAVSHLTAIKSRIPFVNFFDGFRTSHEIQKIEELQMEDVKGLVDMEALQAFRNRALTPENPVTRGTAQNPDIYFQGREASNKFMDAVPDMVADYMAKISAITGRTYRPFDYYGAPDAENIIIAMGSVTETIREVIDYENASGKKVGMVAVHLYRPFSAKYFLEAVPASVKRITVLDRTKEPGAGGEPLFKDVATAVATSVRAGSLRVIGGRYGLSSKDFSPAMAKAVFDNALSAEPKREFTVGINDDVTHMSLAVGETFECVPEGVFQAVFYGIGSDGTVGAAKQAAGILGSCDGLFSQAFFSYSAKKSGGYTVSELRVGHSPVRAAYRVTDAGYVCCNKDTYVRKFALADSLCKGGVFVLNASWDAARLDAELPASLKRALAAKQAKLYTVDAQAIARKYGLGVRINTIMEAVFFKLSAIIPYDVAWPG